MRWFLINEDGCIVKAFSPMSAQTAAQQLEKYAAESKNDPETFSLINGTEYKYVVPNPKGQLVEIERN